MSTISRRTFVHSFTVATGAASLPAFLPSSAQGANDRVRIALIGCGGRGTAVAQDFAQRKDAEIATVCDLHPGRLGSVAKAIAGKQASPPKQEAEFRRILEDNSIDAVIVGTQDHWHSLMTIYACQAGKDVYVEKPPTHNIWEGRRMVEAARKYNRVVQVGTQNRSTPYNMAARDYIASGKLGNIHLVKVYNCKPPAKFTLPPNDAAPAGFNWDTWLGPAPNRPHNSAIFNGMWHRLWDFSGGDLADDGVHQIDLAMMIMGDPEMPTEVHCAGGRYEFKDDQEVPDTQVASLQFKNFVMTCENLLYTPYMHKIAMDIRLSDDYPFWATCATRIEVYGSKGLMYMGRHGGGWQVFTESPKQSRPYVLADQAPGRPGDKWHQDDFIASIKTRRKPNADAEIGHRSASLVHLCNIAYRVGNAKLTFDPQTERFVGNDAANRLVRRHDRKAWAVPERV